MNASCQIEYVSSDSDIGMRCGKTAVAISQLQRPFSSIKIEVQE